MSSYTLDTGKKYIKDIFASDCFYSIPEYQRPYVWGEDQVAVLLDDLSGAMDRDHKKEYFIGCMIWNTKKAKDGDLEYVCQDILDGQQRFITLLLLQAVIRDLSDDQDLRNKVNERMRQKEDPFDGIPERNRIVFEIREDSVFLEEYVLTEGGTNREEELQQIESDNNQEMSVRNMAGAIRIMHEWWQSKADSQENFQKYLRSFYTYLSGQVLTLYLATPDNLDDAYNLFTVLNSRGLQLQVGDILRAQNLRVIDDAKKRKAFAKDWSSYETSVDLPYRSFDEFLWALVFIRMKYRSDDNKSLNTAFNFMYKRGMLEKGAGTFEFVGSYVEHYRHLFSVGDVNPEAGLLFHNLSYILTATFGSSYVTPLLHYRECFGEHKIVDFLLKIDNLFSASWLTGKRNLQSRIFIILRKMEELAKNYDNKKQAAEALLQNEVLEYGYQDENASTAINMNELFQLFDEEPWGSYSGSRINKTRYLLLKLDLLSSHLNTQLSFDRASSSVEHLLPQKPGQASWNGLNPEEHQKWVHRLGNIILVDRKKNASLSNSVFAQKKEKYKGSIENRANTNYVFMTYSDWNVAILKENHDRVLDALKQYYNGNSVQTLRDIQKHRTQPSLL